MSAEVTSITVSLDYGDKNFGAGSGSFMNASAKWQEGESPDLSEVMDKGIDLYFTAWKTLLVSRCATGVISSSNFKIAIGTGIARIEKVKALLAKMEDMPLDQLIASVKAEQAKTDK
jgi:hypothetical protein